jgi:hypothetical protein
LYVPRLSAPALTVHRVDTVAETWKVVVILVAALAPPAAAAMTAATVIVRILRMGPILS